jgi:hypothetical protein
VGVNFRIELFWFFEEIKDCLDAIITKNFVYKYLNKYLLAWPLHMLEQHICARGHTSSA